MIETKFKHTEIGLIPNDWEVKSIKEATPLQRGFDLPKKDQKDGPYPVVYSNGICSYHDKYMVKGPGVVTGRSGTIGNIHYVESDFWPHNTSLWVTAFNGNHPKFVYYLFRTFDWKQFSAGSGVPTLNRNSVHEKKLPFPPTLAEQEKIANALSKIDSLITDLDALIEKKRAIKTGTMQQLLTGKKRLNGFTGEWERVTFEDVISRFATGLNPRNNFVLNNGGFLYYVTIKDFKDGVLYFESCDRINEVAFELIQKRADLKKGDLLFSSIGRVGDAYVIKEDPKDWNINESVYNLRPNYDKITSDFLYFMIKSKDVSNKLQEAVTGSTLRSIKMSHLKQISFFIPPTIDEQNAIASILSSMDTEIAALEQKRDKYIAIKQGMMQNLLTGKIRLV